MTISQLTVITVDGKHKNKEERFLKPLLNVGSTSDNECKCVTDTPDDVNQLLLKNNTFSGRRC